MSSKEKQQKQPQPGRMVNRSVQTAETAQTATALESAPAPAFLPAFSSPQQTINQLQRLHNPQARQTLFRSIQSQHGNQYAGQLARSYQSQKNKPTVIQRTSLLTSEDEQQALEAMKTEAGDKSYKSQDAINKLTNTGYFAIRPDGKISDPKSKEAQEWLYIRDELVPQVTKTKSSGDKGNSASSGEVDLKATIKYIKKNYPTLYELASVLLGTPTDIIEWVAEKLGLTFKDIAKTGDNSKKSNSGGGGGGGNHDVDPVEPTEPTEPIKPTEPTKPIGPITNDSIKAALNKLELTETQRAMETFVKPELIHLVPHKPGAKGGNPRHVVWGPLTDLLQEYNVERKKPDFTAEKKAEYQEKIADAEKAAEARMRKRGTKQSTIDAYKAIGYTDETEKTRLTADFEVVDYQVKIGDNIVKLNSVRAGDLVERPGGFQSEFLNSKGQSVSPKPSKEAIDKALDLVFKKREGASEAENADNDTQRGIAKSYSKVVGKAEGSLTSLNTYDRLAITLGSGVGAAGVLQGLFDNFKQSDPEGFDRLFGQYGIDIKSGSGKGNDKFVVTNPETGEVLKDGVDKNKKHLENDDEALPAREYIANNPKLLAVLVAAGADPAWQAQLYTGAFGSVKRGCGFNLRVNDATSFNVFNFLDGHVTENQLKVAMFTLSDKFHGAGSPSAEFTVGLATEYSRLAKEHGADANQPGTMPDAVRKGLALYLIAANNRKKHIPKALGIKSYSELTS